LEYTEPYFSVKIIHTHLYIYILVCCGILSNILVLR